MPDRTAPSLTRQHLLDMMQTVRKTAMLRAGVDLGVFDCFADGPKDAQSVAEAVNADPRGTQILLSALVASGFLDLLDEKFRLVPGAAELLVRSSPEYYGDSVRIASSDYEWDALRRFADAVRKGGTVMDAHAETPGYPYWEDFASYTTTQTAEVAGLVTEILAPWASQRPSLDILDVACGHGLYGFTLAAANPQARVWDVDWPNVIEVAQDHAERLGVRARTCSIPGDMFEVPLGGPYDVVLITNVLHHFSRQRATALLRRLRTAVKPDGKLVAVTITKGEDSPRPEPDPAPVRSAHASVDPRGRGSLGGRLPPDASRGRLRRRQAALPAIYPAPRLCRRSRLKSKRCSSYEDRRAWLPGHEHAADLRRPSGRHPLRGGGIQRQR